MCNLKGQLDWISDKSPPSDATAIGTAMHAGCEGILLGADEDTCRQMIVHAFMQEANTPGYRNLNQVSNADAIQMATRCWEVWLDSIYPQVTNIDTIEHTFKLKVDERNRNDGGIRELWISGTWDLDEGVGRPQWDWKTAGGKYIPWQLQRWAHQPTFYTLAKAILLREIYPDALDWTYTFNYGVVIKKKGEPEPQVFDVTRNRQDWAWLIEHMWEAVDQSLVRTAPRDDTGWWCSTKWCDHWSQCKGSQRTLPLTIRNASNQQQLETV